MTRIKILTRDEMNAEQRSAFDAAKAAGAPTGGPYTAYIRIPKLMRLTREVSDTLRASALTGRERQMAVLIAVRPEKIGLTAGQNPTGNNCLAGTVTSTVFSGSSTTYRIAVGNQTIAVFQQNTEPGRFHPDDRVTLRWAPEHNVLVTP